MKGLFHSWGCDRRCVLFVYASVCVHVCYTFLRGLAGSIAHSQKVQRIESTSYDIVASSIAEGSRLPP